MSSEHATTLFEHNGTTASFFAAEVHVLSYLMYAFHFRTSFMVQCHLTSYILRDQFSRSPTTELRSKDFTYVEVEHILVSIWLTKTF
jgi:hypothetical protein